MKFKILLSFLLASAVLPARAINVWINEIHYDNVGADAGEFIEIAGVAGTDLSGYSLVLYNGNGGAVYDTDALVGVIPSLQNGYGVLAFSYPVNGIQNGSPDGIALVSGGTVLQFLSYEGTFTAVGGAANGLMSTDIGVSETGTELVGMSLQLTGIGSSYEDFSWESPQAHTPGAVNAGQFFPASVPDSLPWPFSAATLIAIVALSRRFSRHCVA